MQNPFCKRDPSKKVVLVFRFSFASEKGLGYFCLFASFEKGTYPKEPALGTPRPGTEVSRDPKRVRKESERVSRAECPKSAPRSPKRVQEESDGRPRDTLRFRSPPGKPNQRKGQNEKFMNFAPIFVNSGVFFFCGEDKHDSH